MQLFKVLLSLKVVKFDTKMYLNISNFRGRTSAGGDKPWSKNGDKCWMGGLTKFLPDGGPPPPVPPGKKNLVGACKIVSVNVDFLLYMHQMHATFFFVNQTLHLWHGCRALNVVHNYYYFTPQRNSTHICDHPSQNSTEVG